MRATAVAMLLLSLGAGLTQAAAGRIADALFEDLQQARVQAEAGALERREILDDVARNRAAHVAQLPHRKRLQVAQPILEVLVEHGVKLIRRTAIHLDMQRGYTHPAAAFAENWRDYRQAWGTALDSTFDAVGLGTARADDGWLVFVAVFVQDEFVPTDIPAIESEVHSAINAFRHEHGLPRLGANDELGTVARNHSKDMARRDYFRHRSPEGHQIAERMASAGEPYRAVGENIYLGRGHANPVKSAVDSWIASRGHRKNILTPEFRESGVGVAVTEDGSVYITQVFVLR